jgi:hypothetical protein
MEHTTYDYQSAAACFCIFSHVVLVFTEHSQRKHRPRNNIPFPTMSTIWSKAVASNPREVTTTTRVSKGFRRHPTILPHCSVSFEVSLYLSDQKQKEKNKTRGEDGPQCHPGKRESGKRLLIDQTCDEGPL